MPRTATSIVALVLAGALFACNREGGADLDPALIREVGRGDLTITVRERGEVQAAHDTRVLSEVEGRATLIELIPEGTVVEAGDKLAVLDVSTIVERRAQQAIGLAKAEAVLQQARKNVEVVERELAAAEKTAETRDSIARMRLERFLGRRREPSPSAAASAEGTNGEMVARLRTLLEEDITSGTTWIAQSDIARQVVALLGSEENLDREIGEMASQLIQQIDAISLARADLGLAEGTLYYSKKLAANGFITANELDRDEIEYQRQLSRQTLEWTKLLLLINYALPEDLLVLELEVENAGLGVESARAVSEVRRVREAAELQSIEAEHALALEQLENLDQQIANGVLRAPAPGLVVYGRWDWDEPVYEGMEVRERQEVIILPDVTSMMVILRIPEAQIGRLAAGQAATLVVDAQPAQRFPGRVTHVATLPDPSPRSQVVKTYSTHVLLEGRNEGQALRPGMNGTVTIEVGTIEDALTVPLLALERRGDTQYVWRITPDGPVATEVVVGGSNLTHAEVLAGLSEGDRISLVRPPGLELPIEESTSPFEERPGELPPDLAASAGVDESASR